MGREGMMEMRQGGRAGPLGLGLLLLVRAGAGGMAASFCVVVVWVVRVCVVVWVWVVDWGLGRVWWGFATTSTAQKSTGIEISDLATEEPSLQPLAPFFALLWCALASS